MNPIQEYISAQRRALEEQFSAIDDSAALGSKDELECFLVSLIEREGERT